MARAVRGGINFFVDFSQVAKFIGAGMALTESAEDTMYIDAVVRTAYEETEHAFNVEAASVAGAGGGIKHMFEWGTLGINTGRTNVRPNPLSERARLWKTEMVGHGMSQTITYVFKPSVAIVPKPTKRDTGMDTNVIDSLSDHVFTWKAEVLETGAMVTIIPKNAKVLLIPYYASQHGSLMFNEDDIQQGYTLSKGPHTFSPGDEGGTTGKFTEFFSGWWESTGERLMDASISKQIEADFMPEITTNYTPNAMKPVQDTNIKAEVEAEKVKVKTEARAKARTRRMTK